MRVQCGNWYHWRSSFVNQLRARRSGSCNNTRVDHFWSKLFPPLYPRNITVQQVLHIYGTSHSGPHTQQRGITTDWACSSSCYTPHVPRCNEDAARHRDRRTMRASHHAILPGMWGTDTGDTFLTIPPRLHRLHPPRACCQKYQSPLWHPGSASSCLTP